MHHPHPIRPEFSRTLQVDHNAEPVQTFAIDADAGERAALARRFGLISLDSLHAEGSLEAIGQGAILKARLTAQVTQACVVTLEPVTAAIDESFTLEYAAETGRPPMPKELDIDLEETDPPEPLINGTIDVGEAVAEHLALALDPYPRAPGASLAITEVPEEGEDSPFKVLAGLLKKDSS